MRASVPFTLCLIILSATTVRASIEATGDVDPTDPSSWTSSTDAYIGKTSEGTLTINGGSVASSGSSCIADKSDSTGIVTVSGLGSTWNTNDYTTIGNLGTGELHITNSGTVNTTFIASIGNSGMGTANVSGAGSTWNVGNYTAVGVYGTGHLNITNGGKVECDDIGYIGYGENHIGTLNISGAGSTWNNNANLYVGFYGIGNLNITDGGTAECNSFGLIGYKASSTGTLNISGAGSNWNNNSHFYVGLYGNGELNITNSGTANTHDSVIGSAANSTGTATVSGINSTWNNNEYLCVGEEGNGILNITNGGTVSNTWSSIAHTSESISMAEVSGTGSTWNSSESLAIGAKGDGTLSITNGGTVTSAFSNIASDFGATGMAEVSGAGSTWNNIDSLTVGGLGSGILNIANHGTVNNTFSQIAFGPGSVGTVKVSGTESTWNNSDLLAVGGFGNGKLDITNSGTVNALNCYIGRKSDSTGRVTVSGTGSTLNVSDEGELLIVGLDGSGELNITDGGIVNALRTSVGNNHYSTGKITVAGTDSICHCHENLYVGCYGSGELNIIDGGLTKVTNELTIDVDVDGNGFVNLSTGGMLALKGEADDSLSQFLNLISGTDAIRWWNKSINNWALLTTATENTDYTLEYMTTGDLSGYTLLTVGTVPIPGDANGDGVVDGSDVTILAGNWQVGVGDGQTATRAMGDFNGDGRVDGSDVTILAGNWQYGVTTAAAGVPEPGTMVLLVSAISALGLVPMFRRNDR